jgi:hypothetical protein
MPAALLAAQLSSPLPAAPAPPPAPAVPAAPGTAPLPAFGPGQTVPAGIAAAQPAPGRPAPGAPLPGQVPGEAAAPADPAAPPAVTLPSAPPVGAPAPRKPAVQPLAPGAVKPSATAAPAAPASTTAPSAPAPGPDAVTAATAAPRTADATSAPAAPVADATAKPADAPAAAPQTQTTPLAAAFAAPATAAAAPVATAASRLVPMGRVVENTAALLQVAANRGVTHARLNLKPVELGGIEVRLQSTPEGISAQLVADSPEAAKMLSQAGDDLRKQLADQNVNLLSLDVSTSGDQQQNPAHFGADAGADNGFRGGSSRLRPVGLAGEDTGAPAPAESTLLLPTGVIVDVLA